MLTLRLELLTGRYAACEFNNRNQPEWPPHPARVFSALVAAHHEGERAPSEAHALRWLECQPAPTLAYSPASPREAVTHFVPVNDKALSDAAKVNSAWAELLSADLSPAQRAAAEARLAKEYAKATEPQAKIGKDFHKAVEHVLPTSRTRQPRTFPAMIPEDPIICLTWPEDPPPDVMAGLRSLARRLVRLGHSSTLIAARFTDDAPEPVLIPDPLGTTLLRWVGPGQLDRLVALHAATPYAEQRVMPYVIANYRSAAPTTRVWSSSFSSSFIVLRRVEGPRLPIVASEALADTVRRALMSHADDPCPPLISGHEPDGRPLHADRVAVVPLAHVKDRHASGDILGVALISPATLSQQELRPLHVALSRWEAATNEYGGGPRAKLVMGSLGCWTLERCIDVPPLYNLRESTWTGPSRFWASVTPVVLDRHPGSFYRGSSERRLRALTSAHEIIAAACARSGLPAPEEIELSPTPFVSGSMNASAFHRHKPRNERRPRVHVWLRFAEPVLGPVLLGAGRYFGQGLFRPLGDSDV